MTPEPGRIRHWFHEAEEQKPPNRTASAFPMNRVQRDAVPGSVRWVSMMDFASRNLRTRSEPISGLVFVANRSLMVLLSSDFRCASIPLRGLRSAAERVGEV